MPPLYPLKTVKNLLRANHYQINTDVLIDAANDFEWGGQEVAKCLMKMNDRSHQLDRANNHFYKTEPSETIPGVMLDFYKIKNAPEENEVYVHLYIRDWDNKLIINSFKRLEP